MRLPRAEDKVVIFIDVDGQSVRAEGRIQRVTLRSGVDMLRGEFIPLRHTASGEINISLSKLAPTHELLDPSAPASIELGEGVIILPPEQP